MTTSSKTGAPAAPPGKPATGTYARFIPREELGSFAAWNPDALSDEAATPGADAAETPGAPTEAAPPHAQVAAARQAGYQDGYRDGLVALDSFKASFARQMHAQLGGLLGTFGEQIDALEQDIARAVANAAVLLARRVVCAELHAHPEHVAQVAQQAVNAVLLTARHIRVQVHPDDHELVATGAAEVLQARGARLLPNPQVARGGCLIESDLGQIDARIETRWRQAAAVLGHELTWRDDADALAEPEAGA